MSTIKISQFAGMVPAADDRNLPEGHAALAQNAFLYSGSIQGFHTLQNIHNVSAASVANVFRFPNRFLDAEHLSDAQWLELASRARGQSSFARSNVPESGGGRGDDVGSRLRWEAKDRGCRGSHQTACW